MMKYNAPIYKPNIPFHPQPHDLCQCPCGGTHTLDRDFRLGFMVYCPKCGRHTNDKPREIHPSIAIAEWDVSICKKSKGASMNKLVVANELIRIAEELTADRWYDMPEGWDAGSREQFWDSLTGDATHKITECISQMTGKVSDPGAFCGSLAARVGYR